MNNLNVMSVASYVELDFLCCAIIAMLGILSILYLRRAGGEMPTTVFLSGLFFCIAFTGDAWWAIAQSVGTDVFSFYLSNFTYFAGVALSNSCWLLYVLLSIFPSIRRKRDLQALVFVPSMFIIVLAATAYWNGFFYTLSPEGTYQRGSLYFLFPVISGVYLAAMHLIPIFFSYHTTSRHEKHFAKILALYPIPIAIGGGIQTATGLNFSCIGYMLAPMALFSYRIILAGILHGRKKAELEETERVVAVRTSELKEKNAELSRVNEGIVDLLGDIVESRSLESGEHINRVKGFSYIIADTVRREYPEYRLDEERVRQIASASSLHDIGKIMTPDSVLMKPGRLTPEEFEIMKKHSAQGCDILEKLRGLWNNDYLRLSMEICRHHHEKWDGRGYPDGLRGDDIPIAAQIVSLADIFDALTTERVYKAAFSREEAYDMIVRGECGQFSEKMLRCLALCREDLFRQAASPKSYLIGTPNSGIDARAADQAKFSREFINILAEGTDTQSSVRLVLQNVAKYYEADRACLLDLVDEENGILSAAFEWRRDSKETSEMLKAVPLEAIKTWYPDVTVNWSTYISSLDSQTDPTSAITVYLKSRNVLSLLVTPIVEKKKFIGLLVLGNPAKYTDDLSILRTASATVRSKLLSRVEAAHHYEELMNASGLVINELTLPLISYLAEGMPGGMFVCHAEGDRKIILFNSYLQRLFHCESDAEFRSYVHGSFAGMVPPEDYGAISENIRIQTATSPDNMSVIRLRIIRKDGSIGWLDTYGHFAHSEQYGDIFYVFVTDVTRDYEINSAEKVADSLMRKQKALETLVDKKIDDTEKAGIFDGMNVLLVDDCDVTREIDSELLAEAGAAVTEVSDGATALRLIEDGTVYDLILMDINMPGINGIEATRRIRRRESESDGSARVPIIALSSDTNDSLVAEMFRVGADDVSSRPLDVSDVSRMLITSMREHTADIAKRLEHTIHVASTDPLTHVKSITAYTDMIAELSQRLLSEQNTQFAIVVCDINNLKYENDTFGHSVGDMYIKNSCSIICSVFSCSPVYRIGGDEFAVLVQGEDYDNLAKKMKTLRKKALLASEISESALGKASFAAGVAVYDARVDSSVSDTVKRADVDMYKQKEIWHAAAQS